MDGLYFGVVSEESIEHHGVMGQRKGHRNGPPYPLKPSMHSLEEKKFARLEKKYEKTKAANAKKSKKAAQKAKYKALHEKYEAEKRGGKNAKPRKQTKVEKYAEKLTKVQSMSDDDLRKVINRMRLEKEYFDADKSLSSTKPQKKESYANQLLKGVGKGAVDASSSVTKYLLEAGGKKAVNSLLGIEDKNNKKGKDNDRLGVLDSLTKTVNDTKQLVKAKDSLKTEIDKTKKKK